LPSGFKPWRPGNQLQKHLMTGGSGWLDTNAGLRMVRNGRGPKTDEEKANLARYKRYFDDLEAGVAVPKWEGKK